MGAAPLLDHDVESTDGLEHDPPATSKTSGKAKVETQTLAEEPVWIREAKEKEHSRRTQVPCPETTKTRPTQTAENQASDGARLQPDSARSPLDDEVSEISDDLDLESEDAEPNEAQDHDAVTVDREPPIAESEIGSGNIEESYRHLLVAEDRVSVLPAMLQRMMKEMEDANAGAGDPDEGEIQGGLDGSDSSKFNGIRPMCDTIKIATEAEELKQLKERLGGGHALRKEQMRDWRHRTDGAEGSKTEAAKEWDEEERFHAKYARYGCPRKPSQALRILQLNVHSLSAGRARELLRLLELVDADVAVLQETETLCDKPKCAKLPSCTCVEGTGKPIPPVAPGSPAAKAGVPVGWILHKVNNQEVHTYEEAAVALASATAPGDEPRAKATFDL
eukprot:gene6802-2057_t